jgi:hypothetical protein
MLSTEMITRYRQEDGSSFSIAKCLNQSDALFGLPVALSALLEVLLDAALAVHPYLGDLRGREEEGEQHRAIPVPAGKVDAHDDEPGHPTGGVQGAPPVGPPGDGGG